MGCDEETMNCRIERGLAGGGTGLVAAVIFFLPEENPEIPGITSGSMCVAVSFRASPS